MEEPTCGVLRNVEEMAAIIRIMYCMYVCNVLYVIMPLPNMMLSYESNSCSSNCGTFIIKAKMHFTINNRDAKAVRAAGSMLHPFKPWLNGELPSELAAWENLKKSKKWAFHAVRALCHTEPREVNHSTDPTASIKPSAEQVNKY